MTAIIHIPTPCNADWNDMTPAPCGRHCAQCCKTVTDFTGWETEDILSYLKVHSAEKTCGRFTTMQASVPPPDPELLIKKVWKSAAPFYRKIAAVIILLFGMNTMTQAQIKTKPVHKNDTLHRNHPVIMGGIRPYTPPKDTVKKIQRPVIMGKPAPPHPDLK